MKGKRIKDLPENWKEIILDNMSEGKHKTEILKLLGISHCTHVRFLEESEEYKETFDTGKTYCEAWWDRTGRENVGNKGFNHILYMFIMKSVFKRQDNHYPSLGPQKDELADDEEKQTIRDKYRVEEQAKPLQ